MRAFVTYKSLDRQIIELSSCYHNLPSEASVRTGRSRKTSLSFSTTSGSDVTPRKKRYVVDLTAVTSDDDSDDEASASGGDEKKSHDGESSSTSFEDD